VWATTALWTVIVNSKDRPNLTMTATIPNTERPTINFTGVLFSNNVKYNNCIQSVMMNGWAWTIGEMIMTRENQRTKRNTLPAPLWPLEIPHRRDLTWASVIKGQWQTTYATARTGTVKSTYVWDYDEGTSGEDPKRHEVERKSGSKC